MVQAWNTDFAVSPLFDSVRAAVRRFDACAAWPTLADYQALLDALMPPPVSGSGARLRVASESAAADWRQRYEARIYREGELPTRADNWHDLFNLLAWASFPQAKAALNARHFELLAAQAAAGRPKARNAAQDALTQFDETGVVVLASDPALLELMRAFRWKELFWEQRDAVRTQMRCLLFGHGLMDKALAPYIGMTGKGVLLTVTPETLALPSESLAAHIDPALATALAGLHHPRELAPVPVLGFPDWFAGNAREAFYDNRDYFRPPRVGGVSVGTLYSAQYAAGKLSS